MIDKQPLDLFGDGEPESASQPVDNLPAPIADASPAGFWSCQWCSAAVPFDATECPACGGSRARHESLPEDPEAGLVRYFGESASVGETLARFYVEGIVPLGGMADRRETYQKHFDEAMRRQAQEAMLPVRTEVPAEQPRVCRWCSTPYDDDQLHCVTCGARLPPRPVTAEPATSARCQWCQAEIEPGVTTCPACHGAIGNPDASISGLTDLTAVEKAAEYAFQQAPPIRAVQFGPGADLYRLHRLGKSLLGRNKRDRDGGRP